MLQGHRRLANRSHPGGVGGWGVGMIDLLIGFGLRVDTDTLRRKQSTKRWKTLHDHLLVQP